MTEAEVKLEDEKLRAEVAKLISETRKINVETFWYPILIATGLVGSIAAATTVLLRVFGT